MGYLDATWMPGTSRCLLVPTTRWVVGNLGRGDPHSTQPKPSPASQPPWHGHIHGISSFPSIPQSNRYNHRPAPNSSQLRRLDHAHARTCVPPIRTAAAVGEWLALKSPAARSDAEGRSQLRRLRARVEAHAPPRR
ncbi:hypothetical protein TOPH_05296 [Tolypocladium ophioglossoides CBS 100239]|uniref:Uncharacterized protein n=1 Tax=Tolypocladium ophioglossoides (strain CBS 100239) TaxID=1163406 RepID=A0A0L0N8H2_TOLOC|nr:hypothetical protein TOPH_05296 [Tolypocladium ophioglossoides CBS 100239]